MVPERGETRLSARSSNPPGTESAPRFRPITFHPPALGDLRRVLVSHASTPHARSTSTSLSRTISILSGIGASSSPQLTSPVKSALPSSGILRLSQPCHGVDMQSRISCLTLCSFALLSTRQQTLQRLLDDLCLVLGRDITPPIIEAALDVVWKTALFSAAPACPSANGSRRAV